MSKLQEIKRQNGSVVNSVNLPKEELEKVGWHKGDELIISAEPNENPNSLIIKKEENIYGNN